MNWKLDWIYWIFPSNLLDTGLDYWIFSSFFFDTIRLNQKSHLKKLGQFLKVTKSLARIIYFFKEQKVLRKES